MAEELIKRMVELEIRQFTRTANLQRTTCKKHFLSGHAITKGIFTLIVKTKHPSSTCLYNYSLLLVTIILDECGKECDTDIISTNALSGCTPKLKDPYVVKELKATTQWKLENQKRLILIDKIITRK